MPIYEYQCTECFEDFEELVSSSDERVPCPKCGSDKVLKKVSLISAKGIAEGCSTCVPSSCSSRFT